MVSFIDEHREEHGVEPICAQLPIAPATYFAAKARQVDPSRRSTRVKEDDRLVEMIHQHWTSNRCVYGARKIWRLPGLRDAGIGRCRVERLMRREGLRGIVRGRRARTTQPDEAAERPLDLVQRQFRAIRPNQLWVADLTYVATWAGFVYVAFVIDVFSRMIVGW